MEKFAAVAMDIGSAYAADILYHYRIPPGMTCQPGDMVTVPFGKGNRNKTGYVFAVTDQKPEFRMKDILEVFPAVLNPEQRKLVLWLRENTFCTYYDAVKAVIPSAVVRKTKARKKQAVPAVPEAEPLRLTQEQQTVYDSIAPCLELDAPDGFLLKGVTGSGKTSVFEALIARTLQLGKTALLLLPEIGLTPQMIHRFEKRFGDSIALMHSRLSDGERRLAYERAKNGSAKLVIGTRSAVFAPLSRIGLIIMDEEGERSYKSESAPRYDTIQVARERCRYHHAVLLTASATPTIETYYHAHEKQVYHLLELKHRYHNMPLPEVETVDMRIEREEGNASAFSRTLHEAIAENLQNGEQSILLLNRRGYHTLINCAVCNKTVQCRYCSVPMTWHTTDQLLHCHYCGYTQPMPESCPVCGAKKLRKMVFGTQRLEEELAARFPAAKLLRMDADTTSRKNAYEENFEAFRQGRYDIMLGTQMIGKGLDFPNVTLVGVLSVDSALFSGDFRSYERTFSLITQVVGRGGRGGKPGRAVLQTFMPEHYVLRLAAAQDYETFFREEIAVRKSLLLPPFCDICVIGFTGDSQADTAMGAQKFFECMQSVHAQVHEKMPLRISPPMPCVYGKINNKYRYHMMLRCKNTAVFRKFVRDTLEQAAKLREVARIHVYADMNGSISI